MDDLSVSIELTRNHFALVDSEDYDKLKSINWYAASVKRSIYAYNRKHKSMHRFLMQPPKDLEVDHINGNGLDNRRCNLRVVTRKLNAANQKKVHYKTSSKHKGVHFHISNKKWMSQIYIDGKSNHLGCFKTENEAALAYNKKAKELYGEHARLNEV